MYLENYIKLSINRKQTLNSTSLYNLITKEDYNNLYSYK